MAQEFDAYHKWLGIPPEEQPPNHYRLLGLADYEADLDVIEAAANQRMSYVRECASGPHIELSQRILNHIAAARLELLQPKTKAKYDAGLQHAEESGDEEEHDAAALGMVTDFPTPKRRAGRGPRAATASNLTWHLPVYVVAASILLVVGIFLASTVRTRLLASTTTFVASRSATTVPLEVRPPSQIEDDPLERKVAQATANKAPLTPPPPTTPVDDLPDSKHDVVPLPEQPPANKAPVGALPDVGPNAPAATAPKTPLVKQDIPSKDEQRESAEKLKKRFGAKIPRKEELFHANILLSSLGLYDGDSSTQWVMLDQARTLTTKHSNYVNAMRAIDELAKRFKYEKEEILNMRVEAIAQIANSISPDHDMFTFFWDQSLMFLDKQVKNEQYEIALRLYEPLQKKAQDNDLSKLRRDITSRLRTMMMAKQYAKKLAQWKALLADDDEKNIAQGHKNLGLFYFCVKKDEALGLKHMKLCGDKTLVRAADLASKKATNTADLLEQGKAWRAAAKKLRRGTQEFAATLNDRGRQAYVEAYTRARQHDKESVEKIEKVLVKENLLIINSLRMRLIYVPRGEFVMGSPSTEIGREGMAIREELLGGEEVPLSEQEHQVRHTKGFYIGIHEVTQPEFEMIMTYNPSPHAGPRLPVSDVSTKEVREFIQKLSVNEQRQYMLPTEAQWEYACRAGTTTAFAFGAVLKQKHATFSQKDSGPTPVGSYPPNNFGIYDMHGNVAEWVRDYYVDGFYARSAGKVAENPVQLRNTGLRLHRGGGFTNTSHFSRSAARMVRRSGGKEPHVGFRLVLPAPK